MLVYVSGPYRGTDDAEVEQNIRSARLVAMELWKLGHAVICPHANTSRFELECDLIPATYIVGDLAMIARCDALVMIQGWERSEGAVTEKAHAERLGIPIYFSPSYPDLHPSEVRCPMQMRSFAETLGKMYRLSLQKNADYGSASIQGTGPIGIAVRLWDKVCRLLSLQGFRIAAQYQGMDTSREPKNESIEDTWLDAATYGVIGYLNHKGLWGRLQ